MMEFAELVHFGDSGGRFLAVVAGVMALCSLERVFFFICCSAGTSGEGEVGAPLGLLRGIEEPRRSTMSSS